MLRVLVIHTTSGRGVTRAFAGIIDADASCIKAG